MKVLVSDSLSKDGLAVLTGAAGLEVDNRPGLSEDEIAKVIGEYEALVIRSGSKVTARVIEAAAKLRARKGELIVAGAQRHVAQRLASYDVAHRPAVAANVDQAVMILKMLRPKTDIRRAKQRVTSLTLPRIEPTR